MSSTHTHVECNSRPQPRHAPPANGLGIDVEMLMEVANIINRPDSKAVFTHRGAQGRRLHGNAKVFCTVFQQRDVCQSDSIGLVSRSDSSYTHGRQQAGQDWLGDCGEDAFDRTFIVLRGQPDCHVASEPAAVPWWQDMVHLVLVDFLSGSNDKRRFDGLVNQRAATQLVGIQNPVEIFRACQTPLLPLPVREQNLNMLCGRST